MKNINIFYLLILITPLIFLSCDDTQDDLVTANAVEGGLVSASTTSLNYVVGDGASYSFGLFANQTETADISAIDIYKSALIADADGNLVATNEVLAETIDVPGSSNAALSSGSYDYASLIDGLTLNGAALPSSDGELSIGDKFIFRVVSIMDDGSSAEQAYNVNVTVSTRFAGTYVCDYMEYWRIGVQSGSWWLGHELIIESIDAITYRYQWGATIGWGPELYFQVDGDGNITYPQEWNGVAQVLNGQPLTTCNRSINDLSNVNCSNSNYVIKDDVGGKDQLVMTYGYLTAGSGPREFHEILTKK